MGLALTLRVFVLGSTLRVRAPRFIMRHHLLRPPVYGVVSVLWEYCGAGGEKSWTLKPEHKAAYARGSHRIREREIKEMPALTTGVEESF